MTSLDRIERDDSAAVQVSLISWLQSKNIAVIFFDGLLVVIFSVSAGFSRGVLRLSY